MRRGQELRVRGLSLDQQMGLCGVRGQRSGVRGVLGGSWGQ